MPGNKSQSDRLHQQEGSTTTDGEELRVDTVRSFPAHDQVPSLEDEVDPAAPFEGTVVNPAAPQAFALDAKLPDYLSAALEVVSGPDAGRRFVLTMVRTVVGRREHADFGLDDPKASRRHASIVYVGNEFRVRDEQSANGTLLNGSRVLEYALKDGDKLLIGDSLVRFRLMAR